MCRGASVGGAPQEARACVWNGSAVGRRWRQAAEAAPLPSGVAPQNARKEEVWVSGEVSSVVKAVGEWGTSASVCGVELS